LRHIKVKMPYGKFEPLRKYSGISYDGTPYSGETRAGYIGVFIGIITHSDGTPIINEKGRKVSGYAFDNYIFDKVCDECLSNKDTRDKHENYCEEIEWSIHEYYKDTLRRHEDDHFQFEIGGDGGDGWFEFFTVEPVEELPKPMKFKVYDEEYLLTWQYREDD
jgi:hypothetical protein